MKLSCSQMDVLITFYIEGDLSSGLKKQVENHLKSCNSCRAKFEIIKNMIEDLRNCFKEFDEEDTSEKQIRNTLSTKQYSVFKTKLSEYLDNELSREENLQVKKFTINNKEARKELQENYNLRKLMNNSFQKTNNENKQDFSKAILKQLEVEDETIFEIHPIVKLLIGVVVAMGILAVIAILSIG